MAKDLSLNRNSQQDNNQQYSIVGIQGTAGTADTLGTAPTIPIAVDPTTGAMYVNNLGASGTSGGGTTVTVDHGSVVISNPIGTGTYGTGIKTFRAHDSGAFSDTYANNPQNYVDENFNQIVQPVFPFMFNGVTWDRVRGDTTNGLFANVKSLPNIPGGTLNAATAQISGGTLNVGTMVNNGGTVNLATVTMTLGTVNAATINLGTVVGKDADNVATTSFPVLTGGFFNGTAHGFRTDINGNQITVGTLNAGTLNTGTINSATVNAGTINSGTINVATVNLGTVVGKDADNVATTSFAVLTGGMFNGTAHVFRTDTNGNQISVGTLNAGTINASTATITGGTVNIVAGGTIQTNLLSGTLNVGTVVNNGGTINASTTTMTLGTLNSGTINAGTMNSGTLNAGTVNSATVNAGTFSPQPFPATQIQSAGTVSTGTIGTLVAAVGAGTGIYPTNLVINANSGTPDVVVSFALQAAGNQVINRGLYQTGGGAVIPFPYPSFYGTANSALTWNVLSGAGTISLSVLYATKGTP